KSGHKCKPLHSWQHDFGVLQLRGVRMSLFLRETPFGHGSQEAGRGAKPRRLGSAKFGYAISFFADEGQPETELGTRVAGAPPRERRWEQNSHCMEQPRADISVTVLKASSLSQLY